MIKCQVCGYENKDDAEFCLNCGSPLVKQKVSEAMDDVSDEATVLIDPAAMQKRIQDEISREKPADHEEPHHATQEPPKEAKASPAPPSGGQAPGAVSSQAGGAIPPAPPPPQQPVPNQEQIMSAAGTSDKDWTTTLVLVIVVGMLGVHRFYAGKIGTGILMLVTGGGCLIWHIIDIIMVATGKFTDAEGRLIEQQK